MHNRWVIVLVRLVAAVFLIAGFASGSAGATQIHYATPLSGPAESPPNASPATGSALITVDTIALTMRVQTSFTGLLGNTTASHIHCCTAVPGTSTAGVATTTPTFVGFPVGVTSGTYDQTFDMTSAASYNPSFVTAQGGIANAMAALFAGLAGGTAYFNIHTTFAPGGEIRGFPAVVPPATHFSVTAPANAIGGTAFTFGVSALDASNAVDTAYGGTVHFTSGDGQAVLPANATLINGAGTFSATLKTVGSQSITATDTVTGSITGTSNAIAVAPELVGTPHNFSATQGVPFSGSVGTFTSARPGYSIGDFSATIDWGDGTSSASSSIVLNVATFTVNGSHTYAARGNFTVTVTVTDSVTPATAIIVDTATVVGPPTIAKAFAPTSLASDNVTILTFTLTNPAGNTVPLTGVGFTDILPLGLTVPSTSSAACGGTLTTTGPGSIVLSGATIAVDGTCTFNVTVFPVAIGDFTNVTGNVVSANGGSGGTASARVTVVAPKIPTLSGWALALLAAMLAFATLGNLRQREN